MIKKVFIEIDIDGVQLIAHFYDGEGNELVIMALEEQDKDRTLGEIFSIAQQIWNERNVK